MFGKQWDATAAVGCAGDMNKRQGLCTGRSAGLEEQAQHSIAQHQPVEGT
jgi:hypothetical protein